MSFLSTLLRGGCCTVPSVRHDEVDGIAISPFAQPDPRTPVAFAGQPTEAPKMQRSAFATAVHAANAASAAPDAPCPFGGSSGKLRHVASCPMLGPGGVALQPSTSLSSSNPISPGDHGCGLLGPLVPPGGGLHGRRPSGTFSFMSMDSGGLTSARSESVFEIASRTSSQHSKILRPQCCQRIQRCVAGSSFIQRHLSLQSSVDSAHGLPGSAGAKGALTASAASTTGGTRRHLSEQLKLSDAMTRRVYTAPSAAAAAATGAAGGLPPRTLLAAALDRTDSARLTKTGTTASTSSLGASGRGYGSSGSLAAVAAAADAATAEGGAATAFGEAFLAALLAGNGRWASEAAVFELFVEDARMATHDKEVFYGKTAIIRRLNNGMEQFVKLLGAQVEGDSEAVQAKVASVTSEMSVAIKERHSSGAPRVVQVSYCFKYGMRKYKLRDDITLREGKIRRLKRLRL